MDVSDAAIDITLDGKIGLQKVLDVFHQYANITMQQEAQIEDLEGNTKSTKHIVQIIRDLAEQSNLLAIIASIEAARAGEHGKGFGVIAGEVGNLAKQTKQYTAEVEDVIKRIGNSVDQTVALVESSRNQIENSMFI